MRCVKCECILSQRLQKTQDCRRRQSWIDLQPICPPCSKPPHVSPRIENTRQPGAYFLEIPFSHIRIIKDKQGQETAKDIPVNMVNKVEHVKDVLGAI